MSFTVAQIDAQTKIFQQSFQQGKITKAQYEQAMKVQAANKAVAQKKEQQTQMQPNNFWSAPTPQTIASSSQPKQDAVKIEAPAGYVVANVQPTTVAAEEMQPSNYWAAMPSPEKPSTMTPPKQQTVEAISYELVKTPEPVKQSDLGVGSQVLILNKVAGDIFNIFADKVAPKDSIINNLIKLENRTVVQPALAFEAGAVNAMESEAYGIASLVNSASKSIQTKQLQYSPVKTPQLGPTVIGSSIGIAMGNMQEGQQMNEAPFGYALGSGFGEVGVALLEGQAAGFVVGKTTSFVKTVVNPKINAFAESTLAKSQLMAQAGLNKIEPGLGKAAQMVYSQDALKLSNAFDVLGSKASSVFASKIAIPAKYGIINPVLNTATKAKNSVVSTGQKIIDLVPNNQASSFLKSVAAPNLSDYSKVIKPTIKLYSDDLAKSSLVNNAKLATSQLSSAGKSFAQTIKQPVIYGKSVALPNEISKMGKVISGVSSKGSQLLSEPAAYAKVVQGQSVFKVNQAFKPVTAGIATAQKSILLMETKIIPLTQTIKASQVNALAKVTMGKISFALNLTTPKDVLLKSEKTPLKFTLPTVTAPVFKQSQAVIQVEKQQAKVKNEGSTKAIFVPKVGIYPYPGTSTKQIEAMEETYVSYPGQSVKDVTAERKSELVFIPSFKPSFVPAFGPSTNNRIVPGVDTKIKPVVLPVLPRVVPVVFPIVKVDSKQRPFITPKFVQDTVPKMDQRQTQIQRVSLTPKLSTRQKGKSAFSNLSLGGGGGGSGGFDALTGKWRKYKNPIKTYDAMLRTVGIKVSKQSVKGIGKLDKQLVRTDTIKFKHARKSNNRVRRRR